MSDDRFNPFGDEPRDRANMVRWLIKKLNGMARKNLDSEILEEIDTAIDALEALEQYLIDRSDLAESAYSEDFLDKIIPLWNQVNEISKEPLIWGAWRTTKRRVLSHGYSKQHKMTVIREKSATSVHYYKEIPDPIKWECIPITQKGTTFYLVISKVSELDAACSVPSFKKPLETVESGLRVLDRNREPKQWQRNPKPDRIVAIETFIGDTENIVANTPLVFSPESEYVTYSKAKNGLIKEIKIDFSFLIKDGDHFSDHKELEDLRPLWLIDGQHRVRGISQNKIATDLDMPFVFFPHDLGVVSAAKIFAEVNTLAEDLSDLHKIFMRHRFQIPSHTRENDFRSFENGRPETNYSRRNSLSYESAGYLTSSTGSPLRSQIQILDENIDSHHIIDAKMFIKQSTSWFENNGPYPLDSEMDKEEIFLEIKNYFLALESVVNHYTFDGTDEEWEDGKLRWDRSPPKQGRSAIQETRNFRAILRLLPTVVDVCSGSSRPITKDVFEKALMPITWVDWRDQDLREVFVKKTGEGPWKSLQVWLENAVKNGQTYSIEEVMSSEIESQSGKGILSRPEQPVLEIEEGSPTWPSSGNPVFLLSKRPINSVATSKWYIRDARGNPRNQKVRVKANRDSSCRYEVKYETWMGPKQQVGESMEIRVDWGNAAGESGNKITLTNPSNAE